QGGGAPARAPSGPARHARPDGDLRGGRCGLRGRPRRRVRELRVPVGERVRAYAEGDGAGPPPPGCAPQPQEAHGGAGAIELRADADAGRRAGDAGGSRPEDSSGGGAHPAPAVGAGGGSQAPREDPVPAGGVHLPGDLHRPAGSGGLRHRQRLRLTPLPPAAGAEEEGDSLRTFNQAILVIRWVTTVLSVALALAGIQDGDLRLTIATSAIVAVTVFRTVRPLRYVDEVGPLLQLL